MSPLRFAEVHQSAFIAAPPDMVQRQFADLEHHIRTNVHPNLTFKVLAQHDTSARYVQEVRLLGLTQRDVFDREILRHGSIRDVSIEGFNKGGELRVDFASEGKGTRVDLLIRLPLPPVVGGLLRPLLERQIKRAVAAAIAEDKYDLEVRGYPAAPAAH
jgi:hypothetical protein